jgi:hypothetical protein
MSEQTITQNGALFHALRRKDVALCIRFYKQRLKQIRRAARKQRRKILWLKLRKSISRKTKPNETQIQTAN